MYSLARAGRLGGCGGDGALNSHSLFTAFCLAVGPCSCLEQVDFRYVPSRGIAVLFNADGMKRRILCPCVVCRPSFNEMAELSILVRQNAVKLLALECHDNQVESKTNHAARDEETHKGGLERRAGDPLGLFEFVAR